MHLIIFFCFSTSAVGPGSLMDKVRWGRRHEHRGGGHQPDKVAATGAHLSGGSIVRGAEGSFGGGALVTGSSSSGDGGSDDVLEHRGG
jgi:hypothetical protein